MIVVPSLLYRRYECRFCHWDGMYEVAAGEAWQPKHCWGFWRWVGQHELVLMEEGGRELLEKFADLDHGTATC